MCAVVSVKQLPFTIGRGRDSNYRIAEMKISAKHCIFHLQHEDDEPHVVLEDLSTFGTFVNGVRCAGLTRLQEGAELALTVDYRFKVEYIHRLQPHVKTNMNNISQVTRCDNPPRREVAVKDTNALKDTPGSNDGGSDSILTPWGVRLRRSVVQDNMGVLSERKQLEQLLNADAPFEGCQGEGEGARPRVNEQTQRGSGSGTAVDSRRGVGAGGSLLPVTNTTDAAKALDLQKRLHKALQANKSDKSPYKSTPTLSAVRENMNVVDVREKGCEDVEEGFQTPTLGNHLGGGRSGGILSVKRESFSSNRDSISSISRRETVNPGDFYLQTEGGGGGGGGVTQKCPNKRSIV